MSVKSLPRKLELTIAAILLVAAMFTEALSIVSVEAGSVSGSVVYTGGYVRVGVTDYGDLGITDAELGNVGFQYPINASYESLAVGAWLEGWSVFYGTSSAGHSPVDGAWGTISGVTPTILSTATPYGYKFTSVMTTTDGALDLTFNTMFFTNEKYVIIEAVITNVGNSTLADLEYKRIVDWDVWFPINPLGFANYWGMDDIRKPEYNLAVAFVNSTIMGDVPLNTTYMGVASNIAPSDYDLSGFASGDRFARGLVDPVKFSIQADGTSPNSPSDYAVVYDWLFGNLRPGDSKAIRTIYAAGDTLAELEANVGEAFPRITIDATSGPVGTRVTITGTRFTAMSGLGSVTVKFDDMSIASTETDTSGNFTAVFDVPASAAGFHTIKATDAAGNTAEATFITTDVTPVDVEVDVGSIHFRGEIAEFYAKTLFKGMLTDATLTATLYYSNGTMSVDLTTNVQHISTGLYRIPYSIPANAPVGSYVLVVKATYSTVIVNANGVAIKSFLLSSTLTSEDALITDIKDEIATIIIPNLGAIKANITAINATLVSIEGRLATVETDIGTIETDISTINARITSIEGNTVTITSDLGTIKQEVVPTGFEFGLTATILSLIAAIGAMLSAILIWKRKPAK